MIRINNIKVVIENNNEEYLINKVIKDYKIKKNDIISFEIYKRSIDSRKKHNIVYVYSLILDVKNEERYLKNKNISLHKVKNIEINKVDSDSRPVIIGMGPAGLFTALTLVEAGIKPIIIEQGKDVDARQVDVDLFRKEGILNEDSNIQFGAGGAGTFSDGKLTSGSKDIKKAYFIKRLVEFGAPKEIIYDQKPHVGTDILMDVVRNITNYLVDNGCEIKFNTKFIDFEVTNKKISQISIVCDDKHKYLDVDYLVLAIGHSSRKTFELLYQKKLNIKPKPFSLGVRIEHKKEDIDYSQYGDSAKDLPAASYKLNYRSDKCRGVYTFCMCPGGEVVAASSEANHLCINGMSYYDRDKKNSNSAILVSITPDDFVVDDHPLSGMYLQRELEKKAYEMGGSNYHAPVQLLSDYLNNQISTSFKSITPSYIPGTTFVNLNDLFPSYINDPLHIALFEFGNKLSAFKNEDAILTAIEARSSSPITIDRDETYQSNILGIYPCGEGAGFAGGIVSAGIDGIKIALEIIKKES